MVHCRHERGLYPEQAFARRRAFGRSCYVVRHPSLRSYIASLVLSVREALQRKTAQGQALKLVLVILDPTQQRCVERVVFDCRIPLHVAGGAEEEKRSGGPSGATTAQDSSASALIALLRSQLGDALAKLALCNSLLTALPTTPPTCTFTFLLYTNTPHVSSLTGQQHPPAPAPGQSMNDGDSIPHWLPVELSGQHGATGGGGGSVNAPTSSSAASSPLWPVSPSPWLIDIRSIRSPVLECEVYIQEATDKQRTQRGT